MQFYLGVTDNQWFRTLRTQQATECNFWMPSGQTFAALQPGQEFVFKLKAPMSMIGGGGTYVRSQQLPVRMAWEVFGSANGTQTFEGFQQKILGYRAKTDGPIDRNPMITCVVLEGTVFFRDADCFAVPTDWSSNIVTGKKHTTDNPIHAAVWQRYDGLRTMYRQYHPDKAMRQLVDEPARYGTDYTTAARLGQAAFRLDVLNAYNQRCAMTGEHTPLVLHAAHIKPYAAAGTHAVQNALLLRSDFHLLFDAGYLTVDDSYRIVVSPRIESEYANGVRYRDRAGQGIHLPQAIAARPDIAALRWHQDNVFLAS